MRGIAALAVGWLHAATYFRLNFEPHHASLAVDFFFVLSGFVIAYAYDGKLKAGMTFADFAAKRLIRLYPLIFIGVLVGTLVSIGIAALDDADLKRVLALGCAALVLFPLGTLLGMQPFPVNNPLWSLFFELIANGIYGLGKGRPASSLLSFAALAVSAILLVAVTVHYGTIERVGFGGKISSSLGLVRVCYPFLTGVLIYRYQLFVRGFSKFDSMCALLLVAIFATPYFQQSWLYDVTCILLIFPLLISIGTHDPTNRFATAFWTISGNLSYPFYLIHQPIVRAASAFYHRNLLYRVTPGLAACLSLIIAAASSYLIFLVYDRPLRAWLTKQRECARYHQASARHSA